MRVPKTVHKAAFASFVLLVILILAGMAYVLITDRPSKPNKPLASASSTVQPDTLPKPVAPAANATEGVAVLSLTSPVAAGANASVMVATNAGSSCSIIVSYGGVQSTDSGLAPKTADPYGNVTWTWTVGSSVPVGSWPVQITCVYNGRSGVADNNLQVTK